MAAVESRTMRCGNTWCRVETYTGASVMPFNACPMCHLLGVAITPPPPPAEEDREGSR